MGAIRKGGLFERLRRTLFLSGECQHLWNVLCFFGVVCRQHSCRRNRTRNAYVAHRPPVILRRH
jgi:hypothetical protein